MKKYCLFILLISSTLLLRSNNCCGQLLNLNFSTITHEELPSEEIAIEYNFTYPADSIITIDSVWYFINSEEGLSVVENTLIEGTLNDGQEFNGTLYLSFNHDIPPFYLQEVRMYFRVNGRTEMNLVYLFFSPWNTLEVYNYDAIPQTFRNWITHVEGTEPTRHEIDSDTLPPPADTTLPIFWRHIEGLAYEVAVNENPYEPEQLTGECSWCPVKKFKGTATGRVVYPYTNESGVTVSLPIAYAEVWVTTGNTTAIGETDANGNFSINYDRTTVNTSGNIKVNVHVFSLDRSNQAAVYAFGNPLSPYQLVSQQLTHNQSSNRVVKNFGVLQAASNQYLHVFHWTRRAIDFAKVELGASNAFVNWHKLTVGIYLTTGSCFFSGGNSVSSMHLGRIGCINTESTTYHEVGHFVQYMMQNKIWQPNTGGTHTFVHNNKHPNQTITEGFANAFGMMVDAKFHNDDNESFRYAWEDTHGQETLNSTVHSFTNELVYAKAVFDLWDGTSKLHGYGVPQNTINDNLINDVDASGRRNDNLALNFDQICAPFLYNRASSAGTIQDVPQYFNKLNAHLASCNFKNQVKEITAYNFNRTTSWGTFIPYNGPGSDLQINTDALYRNIVQTHRDDDLSANAAGGLVIGTPTNYNYAYLVQNDNHADLLNASLTTGTGSFNNAIGLVSSNDLSDNLILTNGSNLFFNNNIPLGWVNQGSSARPPVPSHMISSFCEMELRIQNGSAAIVGDQHVSATAEVVVNGGSSVIIESGGQLVINNNSKLIIERGATLVFEDGASIVLRGNNAVLEINGKIEIGANATFTFSGEGYMKTNFYPCLNCDNILAGNNSSILLEGSGKQDKILEVANGSPFEAGLETSNFTLRNGRVEMGSSSTMHVRRAIVDFNNLVITGASSSQKFNTILLNGKSNHNYSDVDISYATVGITDRQIYWGGKLKLINCSITNCSVGVETLGRGLDLINTNITNNRTGWEMNNAAMGFLSSIKGSSISNNVIDGIEFNSAGGDLLLQGTDVNNNIQKGIFYVGSGTLYGKCSEINNNYTGFYADNLTIVDFDNISRMEVKNNQFLNMLTRKNRGFLVQNGRNDFEGITSNQNRILVGSVTSQSPFGSSTTLNVSRNHWQFNNTAPISGNDYNLKAEYTDPQSGALLQTHNAVLQDNNPTIPDPSACNQISNEPCANLPCLQSNPLAFCPTCPFISSPNFQDIKINEAVTQVLEELQSEDPDYLVQFDLLFEILSFEIEESNDDILFVLASAYKEMKSVYAQLVDQELVNTSFDHNYPNINESAQKLEEVMESRSSNPNFNEIQEYNEFSYHQIDKLLLYRGLYRYDLIESNIDDLLNYVKGDDLEFLSDFNCSSTLEYQLINEEITWEEFQINRENCKSIYDNYDAAVAYALQLENENEDSEGDAFDVSIFPNPNSGSFTITAEEFTGEMLNVKIFNSSNQMVFENNYYSANNFVSSNINLTGSSNGIYTIHLLSNDEIVVKQLIIQ